MKRRKCVALILATLLAVAGCCWFLQHTIIRRLAIVQYSSKTDSYWGQTWQANKLLRWSHCERPIALHRLMQDPDQWIRFLAAYETIRIAGAPYDYLGPRGPGYLVPKNGISSQQVEYAFNVLLEGFRQTDPETRCIRSWVADHFPPVVDKRTVLVLAEAVNEEMVGRHFGEMELRKLTGKDDFSVEGPLWQQWIREGGSNLVWDGKHFVLFDQPSSEQKGPNHRLQRSARQARAR